MLHYKKLFGACVISIILILFIQSCSSKAPDKSENGNLPVDASSQQPNAENKEKDLAMVDSTQQTGANDEKGVFMYDPVKKINATELSVKDKDGVKIHEISYEAYDAKINASGKVTAYLVVPEGKGPFPAILYFHWLGDVKSNKDEFLEESVQMAQKGVVCFLIDGYFPWKVLPNGTAKDISTIVYEVIELRRAVDYLIGMPCVDAKKLAYVGHDYGAMYGTVLSGVDNRIGNYCFVAGMGNFAKWFVAYWVKNSTDEYLRSLSGLDPINYIGKAASCKLFFQFANQDEYITREEADEFYNAAPQPKDVKFYDTHHEMALEEIKADRVKWLCDCLGIK